MPFATPHTKAERRNIVSQEMHRWGAGKLHSGSPTGPKVKSQKQAVAIALSEAGLARRQVGGGLEPGARTPASDETEEQNLQFFTGGIHPPTPFQRVRSALLRDELEAKGLRGFQDGGGIDPTASAVNPLELSQLARFQTLPPWQLQGLAQTPGTTGTIARSVLQNKERSEGIAPAATNVALGYGMATGGPIPHRQFGGFSPAEANPGFERHPTQAVGVGGTGFLLGATPGRADQVNVSPPAGSYVWPADVIAGVGEGNSLAGAAILERALRTGPHGTPLPQGRRGPGVPIPRPPPRFQTPLLGPPAQHGGRVDKGGGEGEPTEIMAAHGELISPPHIARLWGRGNLKKGHEVFDKAVLELRAKHIEKLRKLKGPVRS